MAIRGQAFLVRYETPFSTGGRQLCARFMDIGHPEMFMQTLLCLLVISAVMVSRCVGLFVQHCTLTVCLTVCGHPAPDCCSKRHVQLHTGEYMPFKCMKCDLWLELGASTMPFKCTKCDNLIIYLPNIIFSDTIVMIHYINLAVWECRLSEILLSKCQ